MISNIWNWLVTNWLPVTFFILSLIALLWLRSVAFKWLSSWIKRISVADVSIIRALRWPSAIWCLIISTELSVVVSTISAAWKSPLHKSLWTLLLISLTIALLNVSREFIVRYSNQWQVSERIINVSKNIIRIIILTVMILIALGIWGVPTSPIILILAVVVIIAALAFRDIVPNIYASLHINSTHEIKIGDYIKLETGEEGYITEIGWRHTSVKNPNGSIAIIPNRRLLQITIVNYGRQLKKAKEPFCFSSRLHLTELTGLKAGSLRELTTILKDAPDPVIYYHTHHFLEQHFYLTPEPANDFAVWVSETMGDEALAERLASINTVAFTSLKALRDKLVSIMEEYLVRTNDDREVVEGREFRFMKSVSVIFPTALVAYNLREFVEALKKVSLGSLYFHMFESKLRLGRGQNDFSTWIEKSMDEKELALGIASIDPYTYTMEGLRSTLIKMIEQHIS